MRFSIRLTVILFVVFFISAVSNTFAQDTEIAPSNIAPEVESITLNHSVVYLKCFAGVTSGAECSDPKAQFVEVNTVVSDKEGNPTDTTYQVTGGRVVGQGSRVFWYLGGAKPGVHTITAIADDGGGPKGRRLSKEVEVKECDKCSSQ